MYVSLCMAGWAAECRLVQMSGDESNDDHNNNSNNNNNIIINNNNTATTNSNAKTVAGDEMNANDAGDSDSADSPHGRDDVIDQLQRSYTARAKRLLAQRAFASVQNVLSAAVCRGLAFGLFVRDNGTAMGGGGGAGEDEAVSEHAPPGSSLAGLLLLLWRDEKCFLLAHATAPGPRSFNNSNSSSNNNSNNNKHHDHNETRPTAAAAQEEAAAAAAANNADDDDDAYLWMKAANGPPAVRRQLQRLARRSLALRARVRAAVGALASVVLAANFGATDCAHAPTSATWLCWISSR